MGNPDTKIDWADVHNKLEHAALDRGCSSEWRAAMRSWLCTVGDVLGPDFAVRDFGRFIVLARQSRVDVNRLGRLLDATRRYIISALPGVAADPIGSSLGIIWFDDDAQYFDYISHFYPLEGEFAVSGASFIGQVAPHVAIRQLAAEGASESVLAHEMTHAMLSHLDPPLWLEEGIATIVEKTLGSTPNQHFDDEQLSRHRQFWTRNRMLEFWNGTSFHKSGTAGELSYSLAELLTRNLAHDLEKFRSFVTLAASADSGCQACKSIFGFSPSELVSEVLNIDGGGDQTFVRN